MKITEDTLLCTTRYDYDEDVDREVASWAIENANYHTTRADVLESLLQMVSQIDGLATDDAAEEEHDEDPINTRLYTLDEMADDIYDALTEKYVWDDDKAEWIRWDEYVELMDDDLREEIHAQLAPCTNQEFYEAYKKLYGTFYAVQIGTYDAWDEGDHHHDVALKMARTAALDPDNDGKEVRLLTIDVEANYCDAEDIIRDEDTTAREFFIRVVWGWIIDHRKTAYDTCGIDWETVAYDDDAESWSVSGEADGKAYTLHDSDEDLAAYCGEAE